MKLLKNATRYDHIDEIKGLESTMLELVKKAAKPLKDKLYWIDDLDSRVEISEHRSRDGFIPYSNNKGGAELSLILPYSGQYEFDFIEFGEHDSNCLLNTLDSDCTCGEQDGLLDAKLRIWLKYEGLDDMTKKPSFWFYIGGGNSDAPYFRPASENTIFETELTATSIPELKRKMNKLILKTNKLLK